MRQKLQRFRHSRTKNTLNFWMTRAPSRWGLEARCYFWNITARNGRIRMRGETHTRPGDSLRAAWTAIEAVGGDRRHWVEMSR